MSAVFGSICGSTAFAWRIGVGYGVRTGAARGRGKTADIAVGRGGGNRSCASSLSCKAAAIYSTI